MKKTITIASLAIMGFAITAFRTPKTASDNFEGEMIFATTVTNPQTGKTTTEPDNIKFYIKGSKMKNVVGNSTLLSTSIIDCTNPDNTILLMDVQGSKYQVTVDKKTQMPDPLIKYVDGTITVQGYTCHKAEVTIYMDQTKATSFNEVLYYTQDLSTSFCGQQYRGLKGFPLEWIANNRTTTAISIEKKPLSDDEFAIPSGYKVVTQDEMMQDMAKNRANKGK
jgi:GLPGLI family protein